MNKTIQDALDAVFVEAEKQRDQLAIDYANDNGLLNDVDVNAALTTLQAVMWSVMPERMTPTEPTRTKTDIF